MLLNLIHPNIETGKLPGIIENALEIHRGIAIKVLPNQQKTRAINLPHIPGAIQLLFFTTAGFRRSPQNTLHKYYHRPA